ncbi:MAG: YopX family protein [Ruminococcus sp.]|nr:YopX family protein [Ruminococcus sp.]MDR4077811.1 YopX family protein [Ruminococcus sp.]
MREYLFRGKTIANGKWSEGTLLVTKQGCCITPDATVYVAVDPKTVGQYTGLTDKNGTKIFEGDIVKYGDTVHNVVFEQRNGTAYFGLVYSTLETLSFGYYQDLKQIEVIGNIYDNPELVGGEENDKRKNR